MSDDTTSEATGEMPRHPNDVHTERKQIWLTPEARALIQAWADGEGTSFSAAIETLARLGLGQEPRDAWGPALTSKVLGAVHADLGRVRGLFAATAIDAGIAMRLAGAAVKQLRPAEYQRIKQIARQETVALLRQRDARAELGLLDTGDTEDNEHDDGDPAGELPAAAAAASAPPTVRQNDHNGHTRHLLA